MFVLPTPANLEGLTAIGTSRRPPARRDRCAACTVKMKIPLDKAFDNDCRLPVLPDLANFDCLTTIGTSHRLLAGHDGCATGTSKTETALREALDCVS